MKRPEFALPLARRGPAETDTRWYRIENHGPDQAADVFLYDEIGYWGVMASEFVAELAQVRASQINLRLNSPGGDVWDGITIMEVLRDHPATVNVRIDGLAASIASVIAMAGDTITMGRYAQMMVHEASMIFAGDAAQMAAMAAELDRTSDTIAQIYADRTGGDPAAWRDTMRATTWYSAQAAVDAGLADEVAALPVTEEQDALAAVARWNLAGFQMPEGIVADAVPPGMVQVQFDLRDGVTDDELLGAIRKAIRTRAEPLHAELVPEAPAPPDAAPVAAEPETPPEPPAPPAAPAPAEPAPEAPAEHQPEPAADQPAAPEPPSPAEAEQDDEWDQAVAALNEDEDEIATLLEAL